MQRMPSREEGEPHSKSTTEMNKAKLRIESISSELDSLDSDGLYDVPAKTKESDTNSDIELYFDTLLQTAETKNSNRKAPKSLISFFVILLVAGCSFLVWKYFEFTTQLKNLKSELKCKDSEVERLKQQAKMDQQMIETLSYLWKNADDRIMELEKELQRGCQHEAFKSALEFALDEKDMSENHWLNTIEEQRKTLEKLQLLLFLRKIRIKKLEFDALNTVEETRKTVEKLEMFLDLRLARIKKLELTEANLQKIVEELKENSKKEDKKHTNAISRQEELLQENKTLKLSVASLQKENEEERKKRENLQAKLQLERKSRLDIDTSRRKEMHDKVASPQNLKEKPLGDKEQSEDPGFGVSVKERIAKFDKDPKTPRK